ncbi:MULTISPECIES: hypothetical protein [Ensifer]|uniref:hypothetical protein n=1 Tax=Ensifer TaxID=106591 RepID=UPI0008EF3BE7|nr:MULTISPECIES: hypothetical protein [Ensifer]QHG70133.1 hypothetical protein DQW09_09865 [Ensifer adhaerens]SFH27366.1 hypothetical protein SAMN05216459_12314 [Ensifer sp. OV372]
MKKLHDELLLGIKRNTSELGFRYNSATRSFRKKVGNTEFSFHLSVVRHQHDFDIVADLGVRYLDVEKLAWGLMPPHPLRDDLKFDTWTMGVEVGNLTQGSQLRWGVAGEKDVDEAISKITAIFHSVALPYFEKYSTPESAYVMLQRDDRMSELNSPLRVKRWERIIALAYFLEPQRLSYWISKGRNALVEASDRQSDEFEQFAEALLARQPSGVDR